MKNQKSLVMVVFTALLFGCLQIVAMGQAANDKLANIIAGGSSVRLEVVAPHSGGTLVVSAPDGRIFRQEFGAGASPEFQITDKQGARLADGTYTYELRLAAAKAPASARPRDDEPEADRAARKRTEAPAQSGSFTILNGMVIVAGAVEESRQKAQAMAPQRSSAALSGNTVNRLRNHRAALFPMFDQVIPDDLIVQGSECVGLDCLNGEVFGFDTIRLKENNDRIQFDDTSTSAGFPTNNWQIRANSSASGGASFLAFVDQGATGNSETGTIVFEVDAGAPANSVKVDSTGRVGLRTATPVLDLHIATGNTPAHRLEQNSSGGFTAQTWDIAGNEANFFIRDVTGGSRLPFRIRPGAPTSSIDINASGFVGIGTASPGFQMHEKSAAGGVAFFMESPGVAIDIFQSMGTNSAGPALNFGYSGGTFGRGSGFFNARPDASAVAPNPSLRFMTVNVERMIVTNIGRVGIGTSAPDQLLSVNGDASKTGANTWLAFSDERLKNIKGRFNTGLKAVMQLQPIRYEYKRDNALGLKSEGEHIGFGAQTLQKIIPEAVTKNSAGYLMVSADPIMWTMLNAIKEQQKEIAELKAQVQRLQSASHRRNKPRR